MKTRLSTMSPAGGVTIPSAIEFPSQRRERIDWHKLASIDLHDLASGCNIEILQENLSHVAFCDAEAEFDVTTVSGQRSLHKMFRLAQLIIQYLFLSQEFLETQLQESQDEVQQMTEKYQQVKTKLLQQVEEAKKMKTTNKNMRETVKYINSFALANGMFQPMKCPLCPKNFRNQDFVQSHLCRKHPNQAGSIVLPEAGHVPKSSHMVASQVSPTSATVANVSEVPRLETGPVHIATAPSSSNTHDVDSYRLLEIEKKFQIMNDNFSRIMKNMEEQKNSLEVENERRQEEIRRAWQEKTNLEKSYEIQLEKLNERILQLQNLGREEASNPNIERFHELIKKQEIQIQHLQDEIQNQNEDNKVKEIRNGDTVDGLGDELRTLKKQLIEQRRTHKKSLAEMQESLRREYEETLQSERAKLRDMMKDMAYKETPLTVIHQKPPPSPKSPSVKKPPTPNKSTKPSVSTSDSSFGMSSQTPVKAVSNFPSEPYSKSDTTSKSFYMGRPTGDSDGESESESETETSYWNNKNFKVKPLTVSSSYSEQQIEDKSLRNDNDPTSDSEALSSELSEDSKSLSGADTDRSSESLKLNTLLQDNPQLWNQMREATSEVLASRLSSLGIDPLTNGIKSEVLTSMLSQLRRDRRKSEEKYDNFLDLRKRLENEVKAKVDDKIENIECESGSNQSPQTKSNNKRKQSGVLARVVKNVKSKVKESSKALTTSVSKTGDTVKSGVKDMFHSHNKPAKGVKVISETSRAEPEEQPVIVDSSSGEDDSDSDDSSGAHIEIHNETSKSVGRNLFGDEPLVAASGARPKQGSYFDNKTYGEMEGSTSEWDSEPEYENFKKEEPPRRHDSLNISTATVNLHNDGGSSLDSGVSKPIKLKKATGEMVSTLSRDIEAQLSGRKKDKPAGAIDVMSGALNIPIAGTSQASGGYTEYSDCGIRNSPSENQLQLLSGSNSSNTIHSSLWGSGDIGEKMNPKSSIQRSKTAIQSWDSEDELDISEIT